MAHHLTEERGGQSSLALTCTETGSLWTEFFWQGKKGVVLHYHWDILKWNWSEVWPRDCFFVALNIQFSMQNMGIGGAILIAVYSSLGEVWPRSDPYLEFVLCI